MTKSVTDTVEALNEQTQVIRNILENVTSQLLNDDPEQICEQLLRVIISHPLRASLSAIAVSEIYRLAPDCNPARDTEQPYYRWHQLSKQLVAAIFFHEFNQLKYPDQNA
ncbi:hypothetical protein DFO55_12458 [Grimontella sp. AG753]|nr:hypothetical protein DFO55_12458 [Grimontella sp. AG753]